jgi:hypothetical protein
MDDTVLPDGEYAIVEIFGHVTLIGRIEEVERFGTKMLAIEPIYQRALLPPVYYGGSALYGLTPCSAATALQRGPTEPYQLPLALRSTLVPLAIPHGAEEGLPPDTQEPPRGHGDQDEDDIVF